MVQRKDISDEEIYAAIRAFELGLTPHTPEQALAYKYPWKVTMAKMELMYYQGKLDFGVSLRTAWIVGEHDRS